jgi:tetratricopeptide (TPR) repeat protein
VALGAYFALRITALGGLAPVKNEIGLTAYEFLLNVMVLFTQYLEKLLFPINLNNWHVFHPVHSLFTLRGAISGLTVFGFAVLLLIVQRRIRLAAFGLWVIVIPLLPALYIPGLTQGIENAFTERYLYLPSFGYVLLLGGLAERVWRKRSPWQAMALATALVILICLYGAGTINRNKVWKDSKSLWLDALRKSPESAQPYNALGDALRLENRAGEAVEYYKLGLRMNPNNPNIEANIGLSYAALGQVDQAIRHLEQAIRLMPGYGEAYNNLGVAYIQKGQIDAAIRMFQTALRLKPNLANAHYNLGLAMSSISETDKAIAQYEDALRIDPDYTDAHVNLGIAYGEKGNIDMAIEHFQAATKLNPNDSITLHNLANAYRLKGLNDKADEYIRRAETLRKESQRRVE